MSEPIRDLETAVRELGSLPMPAGSEPQGSGPRSFALVGEVQAEDYDDAVYAAEQAYSGMRGQGYKGSISVDTGAGVSEAELDSAVQELSAFLRVRLALESARRGRRELRAELHTAQAHGRTLLEQRNAHAKELLKLRAERADREDEVSAAVGYTSGLEWSDLVGIVAANTTSLVQAERDVRALRTRVAELEAEREKLVRWHGEDSKTITTLVARVDRYRARATALQNDALSMRGSLAPADGSRKVPFELGETLAPAVDWLLARVTELEAAQAEALRRTVSWRLEVLENDCWWDCGQSADSYPAAQALLVQERAEKPGVGFRLVCRTTTDTLPAEQQATSSYPPALPWAKHMDADDLEGFLADLADAASGDDDLTTLAAVESAIATWRVIGEAQHAHNTAPGPDAEAGEPS
ncbi:hypothetical protein SEA_ONIONKNIGHT_36 [Streptomyces phage OnionKnight]|nr:hypothetical protein SEA_ONIONKNIGHT_36 [Streptomyces phage OnionKnight]